MNDEEKRKFYEGGEDKEIDNASQFINKLKKLEKELGVNFDDDEDDERHEFIERIEIMQHSVGRPLGCENLNSLSIEQLREIYQNQKTKIRKQDIVHNLQETYINFKISASHVGELLNGEQKIFGCKFGSLDFKISDKLVGFTGSDRDGECRWCREQIQKGQEFIKLQCCGHIYCLQCFHQRKTSSYCMMCPECKELGSIKFQNEFLDNIHCGYDPTAKNKMILAFGLDSMSGFSPSFFNRH
jgi:hypothetical protein